MRQLFHACLPTAPTNARSPEPGFGRRAVSLAGAVLLILLAGHPATGASWIVNATGIGDDFPTVQAAISSALVVSGDTILLRDGTYTGDGNRDIDFQGKNLVVRSMSMNPLNCVIDCQGALTAPRRGFLFFQGEDSSAWIQAIKIVNGYTLYTPGAGIYIEVNSSPVIDHCIIQNCVAEGSLGGGIYCGGTSAPLIQNCQILGNRSGGLSPGNGGGICGSPTAAPAINGCTISGNDAGTAGGPGMGGGIFIEGGNIDFCLVTGNHAISDGGGIYALGVQITYCDIWENSTTSGAGGGAFLDGGSLTFSTIRGNLGVWGGGVKAYGVSIGRCTIAGNSSPGYGGGGIYSGSSTIQESTISGNTAAMGGGALAIDTVFGNTIVWGNCATLQENEIRGEATDTLTCCCVNPAGVTLGVNYSGAQVFVDPVFCAPAPCSYAPTTQGTYTLGNTSLCLPANSPCGSLIGATGQGCATAGVDAAVVSGLDLRPPVICDGLSAIAWSLPDRGPARLSIYDAQGRRVAKLVDDPAMASGEHRTSWTGRDDAGTALPRGVYFVRLVTAAGALARKTVLLEH